MAIHISVLFEAIKWRISNIKNGETVRIKDKEQSGENPSIESPVVFWEDKVQIWHKIVEKRLV